MPVNGPGVVQLGLLLLIVPVQYFITQYYGATDAEKTNHLKQLISRAWFFKESYLSWRSWTNWAKENVKNIRTYLVEVAADLVGVSGSSRSLDEEESPATEVLQYRSDIGYFSDSLKPRSPRSGSIKYRVGQVIRHKIHGYRGVIVGWDAQTQAPDSWINAHHPTDKPHLMNEPSYLILVDIRDRKRAQKTYVPEENIEILPHPTVIIHPDLDDYFDGFDSLRYLPKPRLRILYPHG